MIEAELTGLTFLVVDDEPDLLEILSAMLEYKGATVLQASNGLKAFEIWLNNLAIDAILTDVNMPGKGSDGISLLKKIRSMNQNGKPPVFIVTGYSPQSEQEAYEAGANKVFAKPYKIEEIVSELIDLKL